MKASNDTPGRTEMMEETEKITHSAAEAAEKPETADIEVRGECDERRSYNRRV